MNKHFITQFLYNNKYIILLFLVLSFVLYGNSLRNDFIVVDDLAGIVNSTTIKDIGASLKSFNIATIVYSFSYALFGITPLPLRVLAIVTHGVVALLLYGIMKSVFNKKTAIIAAVLFLAHPVNTESLNWVSAQFYIVMAMFLYSAIASHILYRKTNNKKFLFLTAGIITIEFIVIQHPWVLVVPAAVVVADFFLVKKRLDFPFYLFFGALLSPILLLFIFKNLLTSIDQRQTTRQASTGTLANQQLLAPIYEGYPYSVFTLTRLYIFPKNLTMYYDGNPVTKNDLNYMKIVLALYIAATLFFLFKDKRIAGLLILILLFIAPVFAPQKITWYMTERYLYAGTGFFTTLLALLILYIEKKMHWKQFSIVATALLILLYGMRTWTRNTEWKNSETIAKATIKTSPSTIRPYNDLGGYYIMQKRYDEAKKSYVQALHVGGSVTAMRNLGYIYFQRGFDPNIKTIALPYDKIVALGMKAQQDQEYDIALYYFNEAYAQNPIDTRVLNTLGTIYADAGLFDKSSEVLQKSLQINSIDADTYYVLGYTAFKQGDKQIAIENLQHALEINPNYAEAKTNLDMLMKN